MRNKEVESEQVAIDSKIAKEFPTVFLTPQEKPAEEKKESQESYLGILIRRTLHFFFDFLETIVVALSIFVVVYLFLFQPHEVRGGSMEPSFHNNEYILTDKISYRFHKPERGDVIIFRSPKNPEVDFIKRVIGLPGEKVKIEGGDVYINGKKLSETYINPPTNLFPGSILTKGKEIHIPEDEYFVLGDNRPHSSDSREFGPISKGLIVGRAFMRYWPLEKIGPFKETDYSLLNI